MPPTCLTCSSLVARFHTTCEVGGDSRRQPLLTPFSFFSAAQIPVKLVTEAPPCLAHHGSNEVSVQSRVRQAGVKPCAVPYVTRLAFGSHGAVFSYHPLSTARTPYLCKSIFVPNAL